MSGRVRDRESERQGERVPGRVRDRESERQERIHVRYTYMNITYVDLHPMC